MSNIVTIFQKHYIVPDLLTTAPKEPLKVVYENRKTVNIAEELTPTQVKSEPTVEWAVKDGEYYTLAMIDPDAPSREKPTFREWHHWLIGNIQNCELRKRELLSEYIGAGPPKGTGLHRYILLVYKQQQKIDFSKITKLKNIREKTEENFQYLNLLKNFNWVPLAGTFFVSKYDDYVPKLYSKLKGK